MLDDNFYWGRHGGGGNGTGVLVLAGSSGRIDTARVDILASHGTTVLGVRWFGGQGLPDVPLQVQLENFIDALDLLSAECDRLVLMGLSYGAEAALLTATQDRRPAAVIALAPTDVAWEGQARRDDDPVLSKWTWLGMDVPFVPLDRHWHPAAGKPAFVDLYLRSRELAGHAALEAAAIPVENISGEVLLVAGGDDKVWPSTLACRRIQDRRQKVGLPTTVIIDPAAGHPIVLPGEAPASLDRPYQVGGDEDAPARLGQAAWPHIARLLHIQP